MIKLILLKAYQISYTLEDSTAWGLDIATHLEVIESYALDADTWQQIASEHQMPRA